MYICKLFISSQYIVLIHHLAFCDTCFQHVSSLSCCVKNDHSTDCSTCNRLECHSSRHTSGPPVTWAQGRPSCAPISLSLYTLSSSFSLFTEALCAGPSTVRGPPSHSLTSRCFESGLDSQSLSRTCIHIVRSVSLFPSQDVWMCLSVCGCCTLCFCVVCPCFRASS